jgi:hypothetical protein
MCALSGNFSGARYTVMKILCAIGGSGAKSLASENGIVAIETTSRSTRPAVTQLP